MALKETKLRNMFDEADRLWDAGKLEEAFNLFLVAAKQGDTSAQISLGYFFDTGIHLKKDTKKALYWYKKAARNKSAAACSNIGTVYRDVGNVERARFWFLKAIESNDGDAALELGKLYLESQNKKGLLQASKYLRLALRSKNITQDSVEEAKLLLEGLQKTK